MNRRGFLAGAALSAAAAQVANAAEPVVEAALSGEPHKGKVLALITPHLDDGPIFAGGTLAKLLREGYAGYFIRTSNDEKDSYRLSLGETVLANERDTAELVRTVGLVRSFDLSYRNHRMDDVARTELRGRLIFLFRLLRVDTVLSYDPWGHYEENPDHYVTAQAVEAACWMAAGNLDLPEHFAAGLKPHAVSEKYYFARGPQLVNRVVDISAVVPQKIAAVRSCRTMIDHMIRDLSDSVAARKLRLRNTDPDEFIRSTIIERNAELGAKHGVAHAEAFHYIGPDTSADEYLRRNTVPL